MQVGVRVARQPAARLALEPGEDPLGDQRDDVEVDPPQRHRHQRAPAAPPRTTGDGDRVVGDTGTDGHDRLAERDDDDQPVPLGEVRRAVDAPALGAGEEDAAVVDDQREHPERRLPRRADGAARDEQQAGDRGRDRGDEEPPPQGAVVAGRDDVHAEVGEAHGGVAGGEHERAEETTRLVLERLGDREGDDEERAHRDHHRQAQQPLVGLGLVAEPGVRRPAEPQQRHQHEPPTEPARGRVVGHQLGHLGDREDEDQVEEQLQRGDPVRLVGRPHHEGGGAQHGRQRVTGSVPSSPAVR